MGLAQFLNWSTEKRDGSRRSFLAQVLDPVGVCIEPAAIDPYVEPVLPDADDGDAAAATAGGGEVVTDGSDEAPPPPPPPPMTDEVSPSV
ncbi:hypothetical protein MMPV_003705 [Pyropia vietnamensis]